MNCSSKGIFYRCFKNELMFENYLDELPLSLRKPLCKFRTSNHRLPIEKGRWNGIPLENRICCNDPHKIGDEYHAIFECSKVTEERKQYLKRYHYTHPNTHKLGQLFQTTTFQSIKLAKFVKHIMSHYN